MTVADIASPVPTEWPHSQSRPGWQTDLGSRSRLDDSDLGLVI